MTSTNAQPALRIDGTLVLSAIPTVPSLAERRRILRHRHRQSMSVVSWGLVSLGLAWALLAAVVGLTHP